MSGGSREYIPIPLDQLRTNKNHSAGTSLVPASRVQGVADETPEQRLLRLIGHLEQLAGLGPGRTATGADMSNGNGNGISRYYPTAQEPMTSEGQCACVPPAGSAPSVQAAREAMMQGYNRGMVMPVPGTYIPWQPDLGSCPTNLSRLLCWMYKGLCSFNKFGHIASVRLNTNTITLPDPLVPANGFQIGPEGAAQAMGVFFPRDWVAEAAFKGIHRLKVSYTVTITETVSGLTPQDITRALFDDLDFKILQVGSENNIHVAVNIGDANDAERSELAPRAGGFYLAEGREFIPFVFAPEVFAFDFAGQGPGVAGDIYNVTAAIRTWWTEVC